MTPTSAEKIDGESKIATVHRLISGKDARVWLKYPSQYGVYQISDVTLTKMYAYKYAYCCDTDHDNDANVVSVEQSALIKKRVFIFDHEREHPNAAVMRWTNRRFNLEGTPFFWKPGDPYTGSIAWRQFHAKKMGESQFIARLMNSSNALLGLLDLRNGKSKEELLNTVIHPHFVERVVNARHQHEKILHTYGVYDAPELSNGGLPFQIVSKTWAEYLRKGVPLRFKDVLLGSPPK